MEKSLYYLLSDISQNIDRLFSDDNEDILMGKDELDSLNNDLKELLMKEK
jgi:hypothetical protein